MEAPQPKRDRKPRNRLGGRTQSPAVPFPIAPQRAARHRTPRATSKETVMLTLLRTAVLVLPLVAVAACHKDGPAERAGESIDNAGQSVKDAIDPPGPAEKAGRAIDRAVN